MCIHCVCVCVYAVTHFSYISDHRRRVCPTAHQSVGSAYTKTCSDGSDSYHFEEEKSFSFYFLFFFFACSSSPFVFLCVCVSIGGDARERQSINLFSPEQGRKMFVSGWASFVLFFFEEVTTIRSFLPSSTEVEFYHRVKISFAIRGGLHSFNRVVRFQSAVSRPHSQ